MSDPGAEAIASFHQWNAAFNARDTEAQLAEMHFPHVRLSGENDFHRWERPDDFRAQQPSYTERLAAERWHHTATAAIEATQSAGDKVHLVIRQSRQRADGTEYNGFDTLWIFTKLDGRWGVQFRSSFLGNAVEGAKPG